MNAKQFPTNASDMTADQTVEAVREQSRQFTQQEVDYQQDAGDETKNCGLCYFWQGAGRCQVVGGEINQAGLSDLYINKEQQDVAMDEGEDMSKQNGKHETKAFSVGECKVIDEDQGIVEHLVAVMGNVDLGDDIIHPGAFTKTIAERGHKVKVVDSHNYGSAMDVIGKPIALWEVDRAGLPSSVLAEFPMASGGLMARTQFLLDTHKGSEIFTRIKAGAIDQYSIGYDPLDMDYSKAMVDGDERTVRNLRTIKLGEYSPVVFAMNEATATVSAKAVTSYQDLPLAARDVAWDSTAAEGRVREWAGGEDSMDWEKYAKAFFWHDADNSEVFQSYKMGYADVIDGKLTAIPRSVFAVAGVLEGARGGADIPDAEQARIKEQAGQYYAKMRKEFDDDSLVPPWDKAVKEILFAERYKAFLEKHNIPTETGGELQEAITQYLLDEKAGRMLSAANAGHISNALAALMSVLERAGIDVPGFGGDEEDEEEDMAKARYVVLLNERATAEEVNRISHYFNEWLDNDKRACVISGGAKIVQLNDDDSMRVAEVLSEQIFSDMLKGDPSSEPVGILSKQDIAALAEKQETPAPEKAADNEHQAGPQVAPTSDDDVLNHIKTLELELELQEV